MSEAKKNEQQVHAPVAISAEKIAASKAEIIKLLEGVEGAEKLGDLIERGKKKGKLSSSELMEVLENLDIGSEQMDKIYDVLETWVSRPQVRIICLICTMRLVLLWKNWRIFLKRKL